MPEVLQQAPARFLKGFELSLPAFSRHLSVAVGVLVPCPA